MQHFELEQGSKEWHAWRHNRVCSSDIPAIMGVSPHATAYEQWMVKAGKAPPPSGPQLRAGHAREQGMRDFANERTGLDFNPTCIGSDCGRFGASLDGLSKNGSYILECKYVNADIYAAAELRDEHPEHFVHQVQWAMYIANVEKAYIAYENSEGDRLLLSLEADPDMQLAQREKSEAWLACLIAKEPPEKTDADFFDIELPASIEVPYLRACQAAKFWKEQAEAHKKEIEKLLTKPKMRSSLLVAQEVTRQGSIRWEDVAIELASFFCFDEHEFIDLAEKHRAGDSTHTRITKR